MGIIVGTDEAGYGPNFGPLVVSASVWRVPDGLRGEALYTHLAGCITSAARAADHRVAIADSKCLYQPGNGLRNLERGVLAALGLLGDCPTCWTRIWHTLAPRHSAGCQADHAYAGFDLPLPADLSSDELQAASALLGEGLKSAGVELIALGSRPVFPAEFNRLLLGHDSKGSMLSRITLELIRDSLDGLPLEPVEVICDKHGGRNRYAGLIADCFDVGLISTQCESREKSIYRATEMGRPIDFVFSARAECYMPVALASMTSKYLRELAMMAFNRFWCGQVEGLLPTAGYPSDAHRFKSQIASMQAHLGIDDAALWRTK